MKSGAVKESFFLSLRAQWWPNPSATTFIFSSIPGSSSLSGWFSRCDPVSSSEPQGRGFQGPDRTQIKICTEDEEIQAKHPCSHIQQLQQERPPLDNYILGNLHYSWDAKTTECQMLVPFREIYKKNSMLSAAIYRNIQIEQYLALIINITSK